MVSIFHRFTTKQQFYSVLAFRWYESKDVIGKECAIALVPFASLQFDRTGIHIDEVAMKISILSASLPGCFYVNLYKKVGPRR
mmetsp:Transcript_55166/g.160168  ORF Transcript_55166/g.160168 Transcript_55166/m.160168 type:complete len:83 (-) Transcript_55166:65-313(-)